MTPERKVERAARVRNCLEALEAHQRSLKPNASSFCGNAKGTAHGVDAGLSAGMTLRHWSFGDDESRPGKELVEWMLDVMWDNTGPSMAASSLGWERDSKRDELCASSSRILMVYGACDTACSLKPAGFVSYRFDIEDEAAVLYVYEVMVHTQFQSQGLGTHMMRLIQAIATQQQMEKVVLTVLKSNTRAFQLYESRLGYASFSVPRFGVTFLNVCPHS
ncbi:N-alpha-acetyltransferase 40 [Porphyridium purpureum]|uniref:N-alpha-acetyltransferase 40 n=1 Tax=Porphyridium purpureum TaxID=35688 RepID=A0A5J4YNK1_PORPP|nr:N-alpha-acetyltransferase 40 [Porphyridium purpureum]|eukprot:POR8211..scf249_10